MELGDLTRAEELAERARDALGPSEVVRLLVAAHVLAPARPAYRLAVAQAVLVAPDGVVTGQLRAGPVSYAAQSPDGRQMVVDRAGQGYVAHTYGFGGRVIDEAADLGMPVVTAAVGGATAAPGLLTVGPEGVLGRQVSYGATRRGVVKVDAADAVAMTIDSGTAVTVKGEAGTLRRRSPSAPSCSRRLGYYRPVTAVAFGPTERLVLAAGHPDEGDR